MILALLSRREQPSDGHQHALQRALLESFRGLDVAHPGRMRIRKSLGAGGMFDVSRRALTPLGLARLCLWLLHPRSRCMETAQARDSEGTEVRCEEGLAAESAECSKDRAKPEGFRCHRGSSKKRTGRHQPVFCDAAESHAKWNGGDFLIIRVVHEVGLALRKVALLTLERGMIAELAGPTPRSRQLQGARSRRGKPHSRCRFRQW